MNIQNSIVANLNGRNEIVGTGFLTSQNLVLTYAQDVVAAACAIAGALDEE